MRVCYYDCACLHHALEVTYLRDDTKAEWDEFVFSYKLSGGMQHSLWQRMKLAWAYLRYGEGSVHEIVLDPSAARALTANIATTLMERE